MIFSNLLVWSMLLHLYAEKATPSITDTATWPVHADNGNGTFTNPMIMAGTLVATVPIQATGGGDQWQTVSVPVKHFKGHHDVFIKYPAGGAGTVYVRSGVDWS